MKILLVDDDARYRDTVFPYLESFGFDVTEATTGEEALKMIERYQYSLYLIDGTLPDINGLSVIEQVRNAGNTTPIVFVSAFWKDAKTYDKLTNELNVNLVKAKPVVPRELCDEIIKIVGNPKDNNGGSGQSASPEQTAPSGGALPQSSQEKLDLAKQSYLAALPEHLKEIRSELRVAAKYPGAHQSMPDLLRWVHNIKGTAGMHGYPGIGNVMARVEAHLKAWESGAPSRDTWESLDGALNQAQQELEF